MARLFPLHKLQTPIQIGREYFVFVALAELSRALEIFCWRNNMKFCSGGEKIRNASGHRENERQ